MSGSKDLVFLDWIIYILNILLFAVPILYSLIQDAYSYGADKLAGRKYSAEQVPGAGDQQVCDSLIKEFPCLHKMCASLAAAWSLDHRSAAVRSAQAQLTYLCNCLQGHQRTPAIHGELMIASTDNHDVPSQEQSPENDREEASSNQPGRDNSQAQFDQEGMLRAAGPECDPSPRPALEMPNPRSTLLVEMPFPPRSNGTGWQRAARDLGLPVSSSGPVSLSLCNDMPSHFDFLLWERERLCLP